MMTKTLLHIEASPRKQHSASSAVAASLIEEAVASATEYDVDHLNLWETPLPEFDGASINAKYTRLRGGQHSHAEASAWQEIEVLVERLKSADIIVISTPMWNYSIPYKLKHYIDLITQPGLSFSFNVEDGYKPLIMSRPTFVVLSSAGDYRFGPSRGRPDLATPYLQSALDFIGLSELTFIPVGPTVGGAAEVHEGYERAHAQVRSLKVNGALS